jgi:tRNA(Met) cytidine acetyltransferase
MTQTQSSFEAEIAQLARHLVELAASCRQRRALVLAGEAEWGRRMAAVVCEAVAFVRVAWVGAAAPAQAEVIDARQAVALLGQERDAVIFDAHCGFDPDAFGAVSGTVRGGGLFVLLTPPLDRWEDFADPAAERIAVAPYSYAEVSGRFLRRMVDVIESAEGVFVVRQGERLPSVTDVGLPAPSPQAARDDEFRSEDQRRAVEAVLHVVHGHRRRPVVLVSDRGRGKSAALGIAAAQLLRERERHIIVTAPRPAAVAPVFAQAQRCLPGSHVKDGLLCWGEGRLEFRPPDELCLSPVAADLLLVDEAAAIPAALLQRLLRHYARIAFATTVHGYEGTGRGFALRFRETLTAQAPGWSELELKTPIRWAADDPVERFVFRALLLAAEAAPVESLDNVRPDDCRFEQLDRDALARDEQTLGQLFGLLVEAHYRTRPNDLRNLLDGPNLSVFVLRVEGRVVAAALVAAEGAFDADTAQAISRGQRRPRGHLVPQSLAMHAGVTQAAQLRCARIMRIAVHPALQRCGLGRHLLQQVQQRAVQEGFDLAAASFGATTELLAFWHNMNWRPVRMGFSRDHASGSHSVIMLQPLTAAGSSVYDKVRRRFVDYLPHWLSDPLRELDAEVAACLLTHEDMDLGGVQLTGEEWSGLEAFARGQRDYAECMAALWQLCCVTLAQPILDLTPLERAALVGKVLQKRSWQELAESLTLKGRAEVLSVLRTAVRRLLQRQALKD